MRKSLQELFNEYILECEFSRKLRPETLRGYTQTFTTFCKILPGITADGLTPSVITQFLKMLNERKRIVGHTVKIGIRKSTVATYWSKLNNFFEWLKIRKYINENPFSLMAYPAPVYEDKKFLRKDEIERIIAAIYIHYNGNQLLLKRNLVIIHILLFCGLRREELLLLKIRDIDIEGKVLTIRAENSKIPRTRYIPLHSQVVRHLKYYLPIRKHLTTPYLIVSNNRDDRFSHDGMKHLVRTLNNHSQVRFHMHQFRHTFAVNFLKSSNNIAKLKQLMGHRDIRMTMVYLRCLPTDAIRGDIENMTIDTMY